MKTSLTTCPTCSERLAVRVYRCRGCGSEVHGDFAGCPFCRMSDEDRYFCLVFLQCEGNMKTVERVMGISYPTIKNRLEKLRKLFDLPQQEPAAEEKPSPAPPPAGDARRAALEALERGEIDFDTALGRIKGGA